MAISWFPATLCVLLTTFTHSIATLEKIGIAPALSTDDLNLGFDYLESAFIGPQVGKLQDLGEEAPAGTHQHEKRYGSGGPYWYSQIQHQGKIAYGPNATYVIWRNVKDYGARGDGVTDDTYAINNATQDGGRCLENCDSSTVTPAIVFFPPGTYMVSTPIIAPYNTAFHGDPNDLPVVKALPNFFGIAVFDADPYYPYGFNWYTNQNNMWRQMRNFVVDLTNLPISDYTHGIHWQVAQATSIQNFVFNMPGGAGDGEANNHRGVFMDNGSGGWLEDLVFNGGGIGIYGGNQQFTIRNATFNGCVTAIHQNWSWIFLYKSMFINDCEVALNTTQGGRIPATSSVILQDSVITNTPIGVLTLYSNQTTPVGAGTVILDNVDFVNSPVAVSFPNSTVIVPGNQRIESFIQGRAYTVSQHEYEDHDLSCWGPTANSAKVQRTARAAPKDPSMVDENGRFHERRKPQYEDVPLENVKSIIDYGCVGDGLTDDTVCLQNFLNSIRPGQLAYLDHGAYLISSLLEIPIDIKIVGEMWPIIMISGQSSLWQDANNPEVAIRVGRPGDVGTVEIVDVLIETRGPTPGAIVMEWNLAGAYPGATGMWDTHFRIGGSFGTLLEANRCLKNPNTAHGTKPECFCAFLIWHVTASARNAIFQNNWGWVADHGLDPSPDHSQIDIWNGRSLLVQSQGPVFFYGGSMEHSMLYNYNIANARNVYMGVIQSETAYMQANPNALAAYPPRSDWFDPTFEECFTRICYKTYGLFITNSSYVHIYGAGLYSFFENYDGSCLQTTSCQQNVAAMEKSEAIYVYGLNTVGVQNMMEVDRVPLAVATDNQGTFVDCIALFEYP